jgi:hypothetical protein
MPARACLFALVVLALAASGCSSSVCPFPNTSSVALEPAEPCLQATLASCVRPTLNIVNKCPEALYMPIDYGVFAADATAGSEVEVLTNATIQYEVRDDKAVTKTATRKDFEIPARLGSNKLTFRFNTSS